MLNKKEIEDVANCGEGKMSCRICSLNSKRAIVGRIFNPGTNIKDAGCLNQIAQTTLIYREALEQAKKVLKNIEFANYYGINKRNQKVHRCLYCGEIEPNHCTDCNMKTILETIDKLIGGEG
jgi:hypothetical protein